MPGDQSLSWNSFSQDKLSNRTHNIACLQLGGYNHTHKPVFMWLWPKIPCFVHAIAGSMPPFQVSLQTTAQNYL